MAEEEGEETTVNQLLQAFNVMVRTHLDNIDPPHAPQQLGYQTCIPMRLILLWSLYIMR